ncbi:MAG: low molecular weight phosphotyrosine protein phosphatase [Clostridia bacterium]|nr:low molecular weight phosphotyrosine protein phosphatase [Clostridia bacterium]
MKIMFVCLGNICRSPMAEFVLKDLLQTAGRTDVLVESAATSDENIFRGTGAPVYPPAKRELAKHGLSCDGKRAVQLQRADYDRYDLFLCMDDSNVRSVKRILGGDPAGKVKKLLDYSDTPGDDVADPWYTGDFSIAYRDILRGCEGLMKQI